MADKGWFITFEGGEGSGKTTLIQSLAHCLGADYDVIVTREPGGSPLGEAIRGWLLDTQSRIGQQAELLLFLSARAQHLEELIKPALEKGQMILCDRFNDSSVAYQGIARGMGLEKVQKLCDLVCEEIVPDLTFYLDVDPKIGLNRRRNTIKEETVRGEVDRIEAEELSFHHRVREGFLQLAKQYPQRIQILDASKPTDVVFNQALAYLQHCGIQATPKPSF